MRLLLECGADPNRRNSDGNTPLHTAFTGVGLFVFSAGAGDSGVVSALLRGGAKPNAKNNDGDTPLTLAVQRTDDDAKAVRLLLKHGANPNTRSRKGSAVLHLAAEEERPSVIAALLAGGAAPDAKDKQGDAALHIVVKKRRERTKDIEALLAGGADPCVKDRKRNIPIAYAKEGSRANRLLASAGGTDWACGQKSVAEAPTQKPQEIAGRNKATTIGTAAAQSPGHADENGCWLPRDGCLEVLRYEAKTTRSNTLFVLGKNNCGGNILTVLCSQHSPRIRRELHGQSEVVETWSEWLQGMDHDYKTGLMRTKTAMCQVTWLGLKHTELKIQIPGDYWGYKEITSVSRPDLFGSGALSTGKIVVSYVGTVQGEGGWSATHVDQHGRCLKRIVNPDKGL